MRKLAGLLIIVGCLCAACFSIHSIMRAPVLSLRTGYTPAGSNAQCPGPCSSTATAQEQALFDRQQMDADIISNPHVTAASRAKAKADAQRCLLELAKLNRPSGYHNSQRPR